MAGDLKITTWNCNGALRKKYASLSTLDADIYILQECEDPASSSDKAYKEWSGNYLWTGNNKNKGLGIFAKPGIKLNDLNWEADDLQYFIACRVNKKFNLLAAWCHGAANPRAPFAYIGQLWQYLQLHKPKLGHAIIAGDLNSNAIWNRPKRHWNHSDVVRELAEVKIDSFYHGFHGEVHGMETRPTFYLTKKTDKPYHLDYIFGSRKFKKSIIDIAVGHPAQWLTLSDHMPVSMILKS